MKTSLYNPLNLANNFASSAMQSMSSMASTAQQRVSNVAISALDSLMKPAVKRAKFGSKFYYKAIYPRIP